MKKCNNVNNKFLSLRAVPAVAALVVCLVGRFVRLRLQQI